MNLDFKEYQKKYVDLPIHLRTCRIYDEKNNDMFYMKFSELTKKQVDNCPLMLPTGMRDDEKNLIYAGDILYIEISTKYGSISRIGVVRQEGLTCCGIDYLNEDGLVTEEGDFIDEFFITKKIIIGNVYLGMTRTIPDDEQNI